MTIHHLLKERIETHYADQLAREPQLLQDALQLQFDSGLVMELRYFNDLEYSLQWLWGDAELRIDTAPLHKHLASYPHHRHDADGNLHPDTLTVPGREPWENVRQVIDRLLHDPLLESTGGGN